MMMTVEVAALELIPAEADDQDFGLLPCSAFFSCLVSCTVTCTGTCTITG